MPGRWIYLSDDQLMVTESPRHDGPDVVALSDKSTAEVVIQRIQTVEGGGVHMDRVRVGTVAELLAAHDRKVKETHRG